MHGVAWQRQALPHFPSTLGEDSNKSCPSHFITLLARADSGRSEPGATSLRLASPRAFFCTPRATARVYAAGVGAGLWAKRPRRAALGTVFSPSGSWPRGHTHLPVFCRDRRPFCWEPLSWGPSGGLVASVPRAGSKVANTKARVTNWPSRSAHMVLGANLPPGDLDSLCSPPPLRRRRFPSSSRSSSSLAFSLLLAAAARVEVTQRPPVALGRACDQAVSSAASARQWPGWCLKYPWKLWCHLNEGVEQVLSRRLDQSETPARLTTESGGGACAQLLQEEAELGWERPTKLQTWRRSRVRMCV